MVDQEIKAEIARYGGSVEGFLKLVLNENALDDELMRPAKLLEAMRHGTLNGGKRIRPFLLHETAMLVGKFKNLPENELAEVEEAALQIGGALELIHCYSLIHDDLPAMDDDDLRRGEPTVHIKYDEATAILAGDALLPLAVDIVARGAFKLESEVRLSIVSKMARACGVGGMVGGQLLDLAAEGQILTEQQILDLQAMKTGALIRFAVQAGAMIAGAEPEMLSKLTRYGEIIGLAFQLADDLLDVTASSEDLGKAAGKDAARGKGTIVGLRGINWTRNRLDSLVKEAEELLVQFGDDAKTLKNAAYLIAKRSS